MTVTEHEPITTSTLDEEARRVLVRAKGILSNGWCKYSYRRGNDVCLVGALSDAADGIMPLLEAAERRLAASVGPTDFGCDWRALVIWNDMPGRTVDDVIGLIDRALQQ